MDDSVNDAKEGQSPHDAGYSLRRFLPVAIGVVLGIGLAIYLIQRIYGDPSPPLTAEALQQAEANWRNAKIRDYDIEIEVQSRQRETYAVEVRDGAPQQAWHNGQPLKQVRTFDTWSVPGMFDTIHSDFDRTDRQGQPAPELMLRAEFDQKTGVPLKYKRIQWGADIEISWRVMKFEVQPAAD
jgi:hypothetical protein